MLALYGKFALVNQLESLTLHSPGLGFWIAYIPFAVSDIIVVTTCNVLLSRSFGNKSSKKMAFPHPKTGKDDYWNCDKPNNGGVVRKLLKRTVNVTDYWNGKDDVNPAKDRTFNDITTHLVPSH
jgi:hypothetical protein